MKCLRSLPTGNRRYGVPIANTTPAGRAPIRHTRVVLCAARSTAKHYHCGGVPLDSHDEPTWKPLDAAWRTEPRHQPEAAALEEVIKHQIVQRTAGRIQMLEVQMIGNKVV